MEEVRVEERTKRQKIVRKIIAREWRGVVLGRSYKSLPLLGE